MQTTTTVGLDIREVSFLGSCVDADGNVVACQPGAVHTWPSTSVRCAAAIFPEPEVDRTRRAPERDDPLAAKPGLTD